VDQRVFSWILVRRTVTRSIAPCRRLMRGRGHDLCLVSSATDETTENTQRVVVEVIGAEQVQARLGRDWLG
jgi:hypothetical protein